MTLKAYCVSDGQAGQLIFAKTNYEARQFGFKNWYYRDSDLYISLRCWRVSGADGFAKDKPEPYEDWSDKARRAAGLYEDEEGAQECVSCELCPFENLPESQLCRVCDQCAECGHDAKCERKELAA